MRGKSNDGPVARWLNRPISIQISKYLVDFDITLNQISFVSFLLSILGAGLFAVGNYWLLALGGIIAQFASIIDLIRKDRQPNTENPLKLDLSGVIVKHLPYRGK